MDRDAPSNREEVVDHARLGKVGSSRTRTGVLYWPGIQYHWEMANNPYFVPFDAAHVIPPFFKFDPNDPIPTNFVKEYYLNALSPLLYKWVD